MFDSLVSAPTGASGAHALAAWALVENAACARRLAAMADMLDAAYAASGSAERDQWCLDNFSAVAAHIGATQCMTTGAAEGFLFTAVALRDRFPKIAAVFADGLIAYRLARMIVTRGALVLDPDAIRALDAALSDAVRTWGPMSVDKTEKTIDAFVSEVDPYAVHRTQTKARGRSVDVSLEDGSGLAMVVATLFAHDAMAFDARIDALARTVCPADPRTLDQRRSDSIGALSHGADRLACLCDTDVCPAAQNPPSTGVVVYVIAPQDTLDSPSAPAPQPPPQPDEPNEPVASDDPPSADEDATDECTALDGETPALFAKPLRELTLIEALTPTTGYFATIRPAALVGGQFLPGAIARRAAVGATLIQIVHPGQAPPEPRYRPSKKLADFVRCRDQTCRFPGCHRPATTADIDHTIAWPYGKTQASNLKCLCRRHHLLKTFYGGENGWRETQLGDGTIIWTAPDGRTYTTTPGSRQLFPELSAPTAAAVSTGTPTAHTAGLTMPRRKTTRAQDQARRIQRERKLNEVAPEGA